jgi:hypothetical protein
VPATRLLDLEVQMAPFDVVGQDGKPPFIRHLGLGAEAGLFPRTDVSVHEMGPPLGSPSSMQADVHATAGLTDDESRKIKVFIERHAGEHLARKLGKRQSYCILPHARAAGESDGTFTHTQFSCAGFAVEAYRFARIEMLDLDQLPDAPLEVIIDAYPDQAAALQSAKIRAENGLEGDGPWPVLLCGYVIHALNRTPAEIRQTRYRPRLSDLTFP